MDSTAVLGILSLVVALLVPLVLAIGGWTWWATLKLLAVEARVERLVDHDERNLRQIEAFRDDLAELDKKVD